MSIVLFTDFGAGDIYVGQVKAVLHEQAPGAAVIDLLHSAPLFNVRAAALLLAACLDQFAEKTVFLAIVDPGVGSARDPVVVRADGRWLVGPDNGLMSVCAARAKKAEYWSIAWRPQKLSSSFHGRDLFAPVAAALASGPFPQERLVPKRQLDVALGGGELAEVIYIDHYGNLFTGLKASSVAHNAELRMADWRIRYARTFAEGGDADVFWYENSLGLVEIASTRASAAARLGARLGDLVTID